MAVGLFLAALLVLSPQVLSPQVPAEDWSRFRGPNGQGISTGTGFPVEFGATKNLVWRTPVRPGKSSPVLTSKHIFLTGFENQTLYTQCFDRSTGKLLWERSEPLKRQDGVNLLNHPAAITPVADGENVYVFFKDFGLLSYDAAGKLRWRVPMGPFTNSQGLSAAPIIAREPAGDSLILQIDQLEGSFIAAYSLSSGKTIWKIAREESESWGTPILYDRPGKPLQIVAVGPKQVGLYQAGDGKRTLTLRGVSPAMVASPVLDNGILYAFGYGAAKDTPFSWALDRYDKNKDGVITPNEYNGDNVLASIGRYIGNGDGIIDERKWNAWNDHVGGPSGLVAFNLNQAPADAAPLWRYGKGFEGVVPSPLLYQGILYSVRNGGILTAIDAKTGEVTKSGRIPGALGGYSASPVLAEGRLYFASEEGKITVVRPGREWELIQSNDLREDIFATPALSAGQIFIRTGEALYCFGAHV